MAEVIDFEIGWRRRPARPKGDVGSVVRQELLGEILGLRAEAHRALTALRERQDYALWLVLNGVPVEPGPHTARSVVVNRLPHKIKGTTYYRLIVK